MLWTYMLDMLLLEDTNEQKTQETDKFLYLSLDDRIQYSEDLSKPEDEPKRVIILDI